MAETGWPLIPRDALPAVASAPPAAKGARRVPVTPPDAGRQLSIFGAETTEPSPFDLAGLLAGPARLDRMGGTARVSVRVDAAWRVHVLVAELVTRGLVVTWRAVDDQDPDREVRGERSTPEHRVPAAEAGEDADPVQDHGPGAGPSGAGQAGRDGNSGRASDENAGLGEPERASAGHGEPARGSAGRVARMLPFEVRTAYSSRLNALARAWPAAADQLFLSGPRLRLWVAAAGRPVDGGYALGLDPDDPAGMVTAALRRAGLDGVVLDGVVSDHGLDYLISGRKPLHRLAELVGDRPAAAPEALWPGPAGA